jgi:transposase
VSRLLKQWGFTPQKPAFRAYEQSPAAVRKWLEEEYPHIRREAQKQGGIILWADELGLRSTHQAGKSFAPRGKTPVLKKSGNRFSLHEISAISNQGHLVFIVVDGTFNGTVFVRFLTKLIRSLRNRKVFLIADAHPVHQGVKASTWLAGHQHRIALFFLPGYSPDLNPDEYFNQDLKTNVVGKARPRNKQELKRAVEAFSNRKKSNPENVIKYFHAPSVQYAT